MVLVAERVQVFEQELVVGQVRVLEQVAEVQRLQILEVKQELFSRFTAENFDAEAICDLAEAAEVSAT